MTMPSNAPFGSIADELMAAASQAGPLWQDMTIAEAVCVLAVHHKADITLERETEDGYLRVKVRVKR